MKASDVAGFTEYVRALNPYQRAVCIDFPPAHLVRVRPGFESDDYPMIRKAIVTGYGQRADDKTKVGVVVQGYRESGPTLRLLPAEFVVPPEGLVWEGQGAGSASRLDAFLVVAEVGLDAATVVNPDAVTVEVIE